MIKHQNDCKEMRVYTETGHITKNKDIFGPRFMEQTIKKKWLVKVFKLVFSKKYNKWNERQTNYWECGGKLLTFKPFET